MTKLSCLVSLFLTLWIGNAEATSGGMGASDARHLLGRAGFGARPADVSTYSQLSRTDAVARLLQDTSRSAKTAIPAILTDYVPMAQVNALSDDERKRFQVERGGALRAWWVTEMLTAATPAESLRERMTLFWHNHFVSSLPKVKSAKLMLDQNQLLRRYALGDFGAMLHAVSKDPAMVIYLDSATNRKGSPNENFAREVMELFTLGEGHYSEQDIKEAARAFTGWSIEPRTGEFRWRPHTHDDGLKTVLGKSGHFEGDAVLDILLARPETAVLITRKLWREFVATTTDRKVEEEIRRIAQRFRQSGYDNRTVLREIFNSPAFWADENRAGLIKSPVDWVVGTIIANENLAAEMATQPLPLAMALRNLGQDLFSPPNVKGWPGGEAWINSSTLLARKQFAERLQRLERRMPGDGVPAVTTTVDLLSPEAQLK